MKQFDQLSIQNRLIAFIQAQPGWKQIIGDSTTTLIADASSESQAENARYTEYLVKETKWGLAQNLTSLFNQAELLGYKLERKQSSVGVLAIAIDSQLNSLAGVSIFSPSDIYDGTLTKYSNTTPISIPKGTSCSGGGLNFITTTEVSISNGMNYVLAPIMQGIVQTQSFSVSGLPLEVVSITNSQIEAGFNRYSSQFFSVTFTPTSTTTNIPITIVDDIYLAAEDEYSCQITTDMNNTIVSYTFGNNITGKQLSAGTVAITYVQTLGESSNLTTLYAINTINATYSGNPLYCTNLSTILGGRVQDGVESIRGKAPTQYLLETGIVTIAGYTKAIASIPSVLQAYVYAGTFYDSVAAQTKQAIYYTAIYVDGTTPDMSSFPLIVLNQVKGNNSPLDYIIYKPLTFLHVRLNIQGRTTQSNIDLVSLNSTIQSSLFTKYGTLSHTFMQDLDASAISSYVYNTFSLSNIQSRIVEAVVDLTPSNFIPDLSNTAYYKQTFFFDPCFSPLKTFNANETLYYIKIDIIFCSVCTQKSRTIFIIPMANSNKLYSPVTTEAYTTIQYAYSDLKGKITDYAFMKSLFSFPTSVVQPISIVGDARPYYDVIVTLDLSSFSPTGSQLLGAGSLSIPLSVVDFTTSIPTLNTIFQAQVVGEPVNGNTTAITQGSFLQINPVSSTNLISDINVSISN